MKKAKPSRQIFAGMLIPIFMALVFIGFSCDDKGPQPNNPPLAEITNPQDGSFLNFRISIQFEGTGIDDEDGPLSGSSLVWTSDKDGQIGTGTSFSRDDLSVNNHIIVLTATDSDDNIGTDTIDIQITEASGVGTVTDIDGNVYSTVKIGDQWWMAENLKVTHYRNGDLIPNVTDESAWYNLNTGAYCNYDNDEGHVDTYGRLYNWYAVDGSRKIAPEGWHVPTDAEWKQLEMYLGMSQAQADATEWRGTYEGGKLREAGTTHWNPPNTGATNESGFTALPGGYRYADGSFTGIDYGIFFWTSTESDFGYAYHRYLDHISSQVGRGDHLNEHHGFSARCVRD